MINSQNGVKPETSAVIRTGEVLASSLAALTDKKAKIYHHAIPGAQFHMPDGLGICFLGGMFATADPQIIAELDKVVNKPASMIFTKPEVATAIAAANSKAATDASDTAGKAPE